MTPLYRSLALAVVALFGTAGVSGANVIFSAGGDLRFSDPRDAQNKHFHVHNVFLEAGKNYVLEMNSPHFDTILRLKTAFGIVVAQNDDGGAALNSRILFRPLATGLYRLVATSFSPNATGHYTVRVNREPGMGGGGMGGGGMGGGGMGGGGIVLNVNGDLTFMDPMQGGKHKKVHRVFLQAGREYVINMRSPHFDTFLKVTNDFGLVLVQNDDGGAGLNSRVVFRPLASRFYNVVATSFSNGATGDYHLTIRD